MIRQLAHYCQPAGDYGVKREIESKYVISLRQANRVRPGEDEFGPVKN